MARIRVVIVLYRDDAIVGGSLRVGEAIANSLDAGRVDARVVFAYGDAGVMTARAKVPVHHIGARSSKDLPGWIRARNLLKKIKPHVIHFVDPVNWIALATLGVGAKHLFHFHGRPITSLMSLFDRSLMRARCQLSDAFVGITKGATNAAIEAGFARTETAWTVYNGVDFESFENLPAKAEARHVLGLPKSAKLIGQVARLVSYNGGGELLDILPRLSEEWHAVFVGDGPYRKGLELTAAERGLGDRVHFTGVLQDVRPAYAALDAVILLARYQPFCLMLAEAMASNVPVFGLRGSGEYAEPEYPLINTHNSVFINRSHPDDFESIETVEVLAELASRIDDYGSNPERYSPMIEYARVWIATRFSAKLQAEAMFRVYEHMRYPDRIRTPALAELYQPAFGAAARQ